MQCSYEEKKSIDGIYSLKVNGLSNATSGSLELVSRDDDYIGKLTFDSTKPRIYALGLKFKSKDSMHFVLPGGGFLALKKSDSIWKGNFKYFGLKAEIIGRYEGDANAELKELLQLKPLGPGVISTEAEESFPSYASKSKTLYFTRDNVIMSSIQLENDNWSPPDTLSFSGTHNDSAPYVSNDGQSILFTSNRSADSISPKKKNLWLTKILDSTWSEPIALPYPINIDTLGDYHGALSKTHEIYFISYNRQGGYGRSDIYKARRDGEVKNLGPTINTESSEADVFIDPNEKYLLFASTDREDSYGADDIYISFNTDGSWSEPVNLGSKVNSFAYEYGAWVDYDEGYIYFNSYRRGTSDIYRIPVDQVQHLRKILE